LSLLVAILIVLIVAGVVILVSGPLRSRGSSGDVSTSDLEAAREAKYREIRDAELDYRTGKLSREDYEAIDGELRAEAIEILNQLEADEEG
jgi:hypothetical protein